MDALSTTASIIAVLQLTTSILSFVNDLKNRPKELEQLAIEASSLYCLLTQLRFRLDDAGAHTDDPWFTSVRALGVNNGPLDQYKVALERLQEKLRPASSGGLRKLGDKLHWASSKDDIDKALLRIERLKSLVVIALEMDHFKLSQAIAGTLNEVQSAVPRLAQGVEAIQLNQDSDRCRRILDWISSSDFQSQQADLDERRQDGTGRWFIESPAFNDWIEGPKKTLFCPGIPGAGKTMMIANAINHLQKIAKNNKVQIAYIFCNYKDAANQTTAYLLAALLQQLATGHGNTIPESLQRLYESHSHDRTYPSFQELSNTLETIISNIGSVFVLVDALDECSNENATRDQLLKRLRALQSNYDLRLMATSRFIPEIENEFEHDLKLEIRASEFDIERYVSGQIHRLPRCIQHDHDLQELIQRTISRATDGMFLLARLHVDSLLDKRTKAKVRSTLLSLPKGSGALDEAYDAAIQRIESQLPEDSALAKRALSWIAYARRNLTIAELCHALAVRRGERQLDEDNILEADDIISVCAGLVTIDEESQLVRLVHLTMQEYLQRAQEQWNPSAEREIALDCLTYLTLDAFKEGACFTEEEDFWDRKEKYPLLQYAAYSWADHAAPNPEDVSDMVLQLFTDAGLASSGAQALYCQVWSSFPFESMVYETELPTEANGLHLACMLGVSTVLEKAIDALRGYTSTNEKDAMGKTPLCYAAEFGWGKLVQLLLSQPDIDADAMDCLGWTPLLYAIVNSHKDVVRLLLDRHEVNVNTRWGGSPLVMRASHSNLDMEILDLLFKRKDLDVNVRDESGRTVLSAAVESGHVRLVEMLLAREDVDVDSKDNTDRTALFFAASQGEEEMVSLLLETGKTDVNMPSQDRETPLIRAAEAGDDQVVRLLLKQEGINVNAQTFIGDTALYLAIYRRHESVARQILEHDKLSSLPADLTHRRLWWAAASLQNIDIFFLLLEKFIDSACSKHSIEVRPQTPMGTDDLGNVAQFIHEQLGLSIYDSVDSYKLAPLSYLAMQSKIEPVDYLLNQGVEVDYKDWHGKTALFYAVEAGHVEVIKRLIQHGASVNFRDRDQRTPLFRAVSAERVQAMKQLIEHGADINASSMTKQTPLSYAVLKGHADVVECLLSHGADVNIKGYWGKTALEDAENSGRKEIAEIIKGSYATRLLNHLVLIHE